MMARNYVVVTTAIAALFVQQAAAQTADTEVVVMRRVIAPPTGTAPAAGTGGGTTGGGSIIPDKTYAWEEGAWTAPAPGCGLMSISRVNTCMSDGVPVGNALCGVPLKTQDSVLDKEACPTTWDYSLYNSSATCSPNAVMTRTAKCLSTYETETTQVPDARCDYSKLETLQYQQADSTGCTGKWTPVTWTDYGLCAGTEQPQRGDTRCVMPNGSSASDDYQCVNDPKPALARNTACVVTLLNGDFETTAGSGFTNWTRDANAYGGITYTAAYKRSGRYALDASVSSNSATASLTQEVTLQVGATYQLAYYIRPQPDQYCVNNAGMRVQLSNGSNIATSLERVCTGGYVRRTLSFTANQSRIRINITGTSAYNGTANVFFDDITLTRTQ